MIKQYGILIIASAMLASVAGCGEKNSTSAPIGAGIIQTHFPGQVTAGGGTSGEVMSRNKQANPGQYAGGTPGIAGGAGGNAGGAATGGTTQESGHAPASGSATPVGR